MPFNKMDSFSSQFNKLYKSLNKDQKDAVDTIEGPVMVIAGPGTGKTTVLTLRIAQILQKTDTPPSGILAITYTDAGVKAMRQKLREIIGIRADDVRIHTFHNFAVSVIRDYPDHFPHLSNTEPATDIESKNFIQEIIKLKSFMSLRPPGRPDLFVRPILSAISEAKKEAHTPAMIRSFAEEEIKKIKSDESNYPKYGSGKKELKAGAQKMVEKCERTILFSEVYERYENLKTKEKKIDFDDMIFELKMALRKDDLLLRLLQEEFLYLLVDEHQDTNDSQNSLILMIAEFFETPNVFIVGDEKQAIYRFQGASVENFLKFKRKWRDVRLIQLSQSFRSGQKILDAAFHLIEHNYEEGQFEDLRVFLESGQKTEGKPITVAVGQNIIDTEEYLINKINKILNEDPDSDIALIVRTNADVGRLKRLCENRGIKSSSVRSVDIFTHSSGRIFFDVVSAICDPLDVESLGKTIVAGLWKVPFNEQVEVLKRLRSQGTVENKILARKISSLRDSILSGDPLGFLFELAEVSGYKEKISIEPERTEIWRGILEFAETILRSRNNSSDTRALLLELLAHREFAEENRIKISSGDPESRVKIMTAHGSKGLEFEYVFTPYATQSFWMKKTQPQYFVLPFKKVSPEDEIKDARRLFYVALTRAKKSVEILTHAQMEDGEMDLALRFLEELGKDNIEVVNLKPAKKKTSPQIKHKDEKINQDIVESAKRNLKENGLSVTALNHFFECPNKFIYRSVLKIPDLPNMTSEKGNAMHNALALAFKSKEKDIKKIKNFIQKKAFEHLDNSFLKKFEIESLKNTLKEEIPIITKSLKGYFDSPGKVFVEKKAVGEVEVSLSDGKKEKIIIHGRLDLVIETDDVVKVVDYKTRKSMTEAAIRGQTKNSDGGYFRQLVFYTLLLSQNPRYKNLSGRISEKINPSLLFLTPDKKERIKSVTLHPNQEDLDSLKENIRDLAESVYSGNIANQKCDDSKCQWCSLRDLSAH